MLVHVFDWLIAVMLSRREAPSAALALLLRERRSEPVDEGKVPRLEQMPPCCRDIAAGGSRAVSVHSGKEGGRVWFEAGGSCTVRSTILTEEGSCCRSAHASSNKPMRLRRGIGHLSASIALSASHLRQATAPWPHVLSADRRCSMRGAAAMPGLA